MKFEKLLFPLRKTKQCSKVGVIIEPPLVVFNVYGIFTRIGSLPRIVVCFVSMGFKIEIISLIDVVTFRKYIISSPISFSLDGQTPLTMLF